MLAQQDIKGYNLSRMDYNEKIKQEGEFWDREANELKSRGFDFKSRKNFRTHSTISIWEDSFLEDLIRGPYKNEIIKLAVETGGPTLEQGCGTGWLTREIAKKGIEAEGYDVAEENIKMASEFAKNLSAKFAVKDLNFAEFPENKFGAVVVWDSLHHFAELERICKEIKKTLKPNGYFLIWDHIELQGIRGALSKILALFFYLLLPTEERLGKKLKYTWNKLRGKKTGDESPFEDVASASLEQTVEKNFKVEHKSYPITFIRFFIARIRPKIPAYELIIKFLVNLDKLLGKIRLLKGEYVFMICKND